MIKYSEKSYIKYKVEINCHKDNLAEHHQEWNIMMTKATTELE